MMQQMFQFTGDLLKDAGIRKAVSHADAVHPDWSKRACQLAENYLFTKPAGYTFMIEEIRKWCEDNNLIETPPSKRAWTVISKHIKKIGIAAWKGYEPVSNPLAHGTPASLYVRIAKEVV